MNFLHSPCNILRRLTGFFLLLAFCNLSAVADELKARLKPATVAIVEIPQMNVRALMGTVLTVSPAFHYSAVADYFYGPADPQPPATSIAGDPAAAMGDVNAQVISQVSIAPPNRAGASVAGGAIGAVLGSYILMKSGDSQARSASFGKFVKDRSPSLDLSHEFMTLLASTLEQKGIRVVMVKAPPAPGPRLYLPAVLADGTKLPVSDEAIDLPADADVLVHVSPIAYFSAPTIFVPYEPRVSVSLVMHDLRTKEFLGRHVAGYVNRNPDTAYLNYEGSRSLIGNYDAAIKALQGAVLAMVPSTAQRIAAEPVEYYTRTGNVCLLAPPSAFDRLWNSDANATDYSGKCYP